MISEDENGWPPPVHASPRVKYWGVRRFSCRTRLSTLLISRLCHRDRVGHEISATDSSIYRSSQSDGQNNRSAAATALFNPSSSFADQTFFGHRSRRPRNRTTTGIIKFKWGAAPRQPRSTARGRARKTSENCKGGASAERGISLSSRILIPLARNRPNEAVLG